MSFDPPASGSFPQAPPAPSLVGEVLDGRYKIFKKLGEGGMGEVYAAEHVHIEKRFAVKLLKAEIVSNAEAVKRFQQEARSSSSIKHRNIIGVEDFGRLPDGRIYMCMELLNGAPLNEMIQHPMGADRLLNILIQSGHGLAAAHAKGIVHRDMKPENIYVTQEGNPPQDVPKLLDFGIAKVAGNEGQNNLTRTGTIFGTPFYMAPEQALGNPVDARTDIYAMGVIMYECFAGSLPFQGESFMGILTQHITTPPEHVAQRAAKAGRQLPMGVPEIIMKCLDKDPNNRFSSMDELVNALVQVYRGIAGPGMSTYMEAFPVGSAQHMAQPTPPPMIGPTTANSATVGIGTPPPFGAPGQSQPFNPGGSQPFTPVGSNTPPQGMGAALSNTGGGSMYDASSSVVAPPKSKTGLIVAIVILLAAGGGIAAVVLMGKGDKAGGGAGSGSEVVAQNGSEGSGGSAATPPPETPPNNGGGSGTTPTNGSDTTTPPNNGGGSAETGSNTAGTGSDTTPPNNGGSGTTPPPDTGSAGSANTVEVKPREEKVMVKANAPKFEVYEGLTKLGSGAQMVKVTIGTPRTLTIKAKGYEPQDVVLDGSKDEVAVTLTKIKVVNTGGNTGGNTTTTNPPKQDCSKKLVDPGSQSCRDQYCKSHPNDVSCMAE